MRCYLGIDNGGTVTKAGLYDADGREIAVSSMTTPLLSPASGWTERDMIAMRTANYEVIRDVLLQSGEGAGAVAAVACCGHGKGLYLWGKDDRPLRAGIVSTDTRASGYPARWKQDGTAAKVFDRTYQQILACQPVALLAWLRDHEPEAIDRIRWVFECKDYVRFCLTGEAYAEITDYSGANLVNLETRDYDAELLRLMGLEFVHDALPPLRNSTDLCGTIDRRCASQTGLREGTPVVAGMFDIDACALATGVTTEEHICVIAGTWSINEYICRQPVVNGSVMMNSIFCLPEYYLIEESSPTSAANLEWFIRRLSPDLGDPSRIDSADTYSTINSLVAEVDEHEACPVFLPFLFGGNMHPDARAALVGLEPHHSRAHCLKAVYEGVVFSHRYHIDRLRAAKTSPTQALRLSGGVARSPVWVQMFADALQIPVEVADVTETGTLGGAILAAFALGVYGSLEEAAANMVRIRPATLPRAALRETYDERYQRYRRVMDALDPSRINTLVPAPGALPEKG